MRVRVVVSDERVGRAVFIKVKVAAAWPWFAQYAREPVVPRAFTRVCLWIERRLCLDYRGVAAVACHEPSRHNVLAVGSAE